MPSSKSPALRARAKKSSKRASKSKPNTKKSDQKPSKAAAKPKVEVGKGPKQNVELPIHIPDPVPLCTTCQQSYGDNEKELLPNNVPLKWRSYWTKTIEVQGLRRASRRHKVLHKGFERFFKALEGFT